MARLDSGTKKNMPKKPEYTKSFVKKTKQDYVALMSKPIKIRLDQL